MSHKIKLQRMRKNELSSLARKTSVTRKLTQSLTAS